MNDLVSHRWPAHEFTLNHAHQFARAYHIGVAEEFLTVDKVGFVKVGFHNLAVTQRAVAHHALALVVLLDNALGINAHVGRWHTVLDGKVKVLDALVTTHRVMHGKESFDLLHLEHVAALLVQHCAQVTFHVLVVLALVGDINLDGKVDVSDVNILVNIILGKEQAEDGHRVYITEDDTVDVSDVNALVNMLLGK